MLEADQREHVMPWMLESAVVFGLLKSSIKSRFSSMRWTVDEPEDLQVIRGVVAHFEVLLIFPGSRCSELALQQPQLFSANAKFARNEGSTMSEGQKLWRRAKRVIPGGNMLLSKRAEMFLPEQWPAYFSRAKGCPCLGSRRSRTNRHEHHGNWHQPAWLWPSRGGCGRGGNRGSRQHEHAQLPGRGLAG